MSAALLGTLRFNNLKYLTSLRSLVRAGSKLTLKIPISSLVNNGCFSFSWELASTSFSHYKILDCSYSMIAFVIELNNFYTSLYSSLSVIEGPSSCIFLRGSFIRSCKPLHQVKVPEIGGILL